MNSHTLAGVPLEFSLKPWVFISGPLRAAKVTVRLENIRNADFAARSILKAGGYPFCPHTMTTSWFEDEEIVHDEDGYMFGGKDSKGWCFAAIDLCEFVVFLPGWQSSEGCLKEWAYAKEAGIDCVNGVKVMLTILHERDERRKLR